MSKEILVNIEMQEKQVAIVSDGILDEYYIERPLDKTIVGNIYKGKIEAVVPSIGAAFVDIGLDKKGFLYLSDIVDPIEPVAPMELKNKEFKKGQEVLVQVTKESIGTKGPRLTTHVGLAGRYLVLMPQDAHRGISRRIEDKAERVRLLGIMGEINIPSDIGYIIRTVACDKNKRDLQRDIFFLLKLWRRINSLAIKKKAPCLIYEEYDLVLRVIRDSFSNEIARLIVDSRDEFKRIRNFLRSFSRDLTKRIEFYQDKRNLFITKGVERQIDKIYEQRVFLKSGAYLVIEPTEGLVVIDVNSGRFRKKYDPEHMALTVNLEAARAIVRQLRLRDLGGIIVIDFIDMDKEGHRKEVFKVLKSSMQEDRAKYEILDISKFGLVEMTRERVYRTIESFSYANCPYCQGRGRIKSVSTICIGILKQLKKLLPENTRKKEIHLLAHPKVINELLKEHERSIKTLEKHYRVKINFTLAPNSHVEQIKIS